MYKNLYTIFVFELTAIFSSKAKLKVLRTLFYQPAPLPLRHIAYLSDTPVFSIQRAVKQLVEEKILTKNKNKRFTLFSYDPCHFYYPFLMEVFGLEMKNKIAYLSQDYHKKAISVLEFSGSARRFFKGVKSWT